MIVHFPDGLVGIPCRHFVVDRSLLNVMGIPIWTIRQSDAAGADTPLEFAACEIHATVPKDVRQRINAVAGVDEDVMTLALISKHDRILTANLRAPLAISKASRMGVQFIRNTGESLQTPLSVLGQSKEMCV